jgi:hypothetical protein
VPLLLSWGRPAVPFDIESWWEDLQDNRFDPGLGKGDDGSVLRMLKCVNQFVCDYVETLTKGPPKEAEFQKERRLTPMRKGAKALDSWQRNIVSSLGERGATIPFAMKCDYWPAAPDNVTVTERDGRPVNPLKGEVRALWGITADGGYAFERDGTGWRFLVESGTFEKFDKFPEKAAFQYVCWGYGMRRDHPLFRAS